MRVLLVYPELTGEEGGLYSFAVAAIAGAFRAAGHDTSLIHIHNPITDAEFKDAVRRAEPDLVGFSSMTQVFPYVKRLAKMVKSVADVPIICGGIHPTIDPEGVMSVPEIDYLCIGEGEDAVAELCQKLDRGEDTTQILSIWARRNGEVIRNPIRRLREDLDNLPRPAREMFSDKILGNNSQALFFKASRGCPYECTYCCEHMTKRMFEGKYVRFRSVDSILAEVQEAVEKKRPARIGFGDETFGVDKRWMVEFCEKYKERIGVPFMINYRVNLMNDEVVKMLKDAGCIEMRMGIEHGNDEFRRNVLKRNMSNEEILRAYSICHKHGVHAWAFNMVGLPFETWKLAWETIRLNAKARPEFSAISVFFPFPKTELFEVCVKNNFIDKETAERMFHEERAFVQHDRTILNQKTIKPWQVTFLYHNFRRLIKLYGYWYRFLSVFSSTDHAD